MRSLHRMRKHSRKAALLLCGTAAFFAASGAASAADIPPVVPPPPPIIIEPEDVPRFYLSLQALYMTRTNPPETLILSPEIVPAAATETDVFDGLDAAQIDYGWAFGLAGRAGLIGDPVGFDFGGFWLKPMEAIVNVINDGAFPTYTLHTDPVLTPYSVALEGEIAEAYAATRLYGFDANVTFSPNEDFTVFAGAAFVRVQDELSLDIFTTQNGVVEADWTTNNRLIGPQVGIRGQFGQNALSFGFELRAAYLFNHATGTAAITNPIFVGDFDVEDDEKSKTLMLAGGVNVGFNINENVTLTAGYQAMWFKALAMAPAQVPATDPFDPSLDLDTTSPLLVHGFALGLTARF